VKTEAETSFKSMCVKQKEKWMKPRMCHLTNYYCIATVLSQADSRYTGTVNLKVRSLKYENLTVCLVSFPVTVSKSHFAFLLQ
jgi:hypothetical protein